MYRIGLIDDVQTDIDDIQVSVLENWGQDLKVGFKEYSLEGRGKTSLLEEIRDDVEEDQIHALIVDFRLDTTIDIIKGYEILAFMHRNIPEFPVVIMTNVPDESRESPHTDADKVYEKKYFLNPQSDATKEMVRNIRLNIQRYASQRGKLEAQLGQALKELDADSENPDILKRIIEIEEELGKYKPMSYPTIFDSSVNLTNLKEAFEELEKYEQLLG